MANISITLYTNAFFGSIPKSPADAGHLITMLTFKHDLEKKERNL
jgi:hypothetical protein